MSWPCMRSSTCSDGGRSSARRYSLYFYAALQFFRRVLAALPRRVATYRNAGKCAHSSGLHIPVPSRGLKLEYMSS